jgi:hydroxyethylthiazole kinase
MPAEGEMQAPASELPKQAADILQRLRRASPRVHCVTNAVAQTLTANALLAVGAVPSMTISPEEIGLFVRSAKALLVNLGTFDAERRTAAGVAIEAALEARLPWVLDPVFIDRSAPRAEYARMRMGGFPPNALRLNAAEFAALTGTGADEKSVAVFAAKHRMAIGLTGPTDLVTDGTRLAKIANGHALMAKVSALGCAESALVAACLVVERDAWLATAAALLIMGIVGEVAAKRARGPGSFAVEILDALHELDGDTIVSLAKVT